LDFTLGSAKLIPNNILERRFTSVEILPHATLLVVAERETGFATHDPSHYRSTVRIIAKVSFWSNNHSCPNQKRNGTQAAGDPKVPFHLTSPHDLHLACGFESEMFIILVLARKPFSQ
jgi:hypothetical protein